MNRLRSLRARLTLLVLALCGIALLVSAVATYELTRRSLENRLDAQLAAIAPASGEGPAVALLRNPGLLEGARIPRELSTEAFVGVVQGDRIRRVVPAGAVTLPLPAGVAERARTTGGPVHFDLDAPDGAYRAVAAATSAGVVVAGLPTRDIDSTLSRLLLILAGVGAAVVVLAAAGALVLVRLGLRPLDRVVTAADALAAGDYSHRVGERERAPAEVAHVARAFDAMSAGIEAAFSEQRASEERVRRFAADASHELRTPLTSIRGYAELFRRGAAERPADLAVAMARIEDESRRMSEIVESLLALARLDADPVGAAEPVWLEPLVDDVLADLRVAHPGHRFAVAGPGGVVVRGDATQIRSAVANLVANAGIHTPPGTSVLIEIVPRHPQGVIRVTDDGPGLPPGDPSQLFERFARGREPARGGTAGGSGLGLAIVDAVARRHGGTVTATSVPDGGARFELALPLAEPAPGEFADA